LEIEPDFKGSLFEWLSQRLRKLTDEAIPLNQWQPAHVPVHLQMNYRVLDEGKTLSYGRDLKKLQEKHQVDAGTSFEQLAADEFNFSHCLLWVFPDLPETYQFMQKNQSVVGFPAMVDEQDSVAVRVFETEAKAKLIHELGLVRLFALQCSKETKYFLKNMPRSASAELLYSQLSPHPLLQDRASVNYKEDVLHLLLYTLFVEAKTIRSQVVFEQILQTQKPQLLNLGNALAALVNEILAAYGNINAQLKTGKIAEVLANDVQQQLNKLIYKGFICHTPYAQLKLLPRYLQAIAYRLQKGLLETQKLQELARYEIRYWADVEKRLKKTSVLPERETFRWHLEEFRVSLFAQQLKTAYPVSAKRLDKAWDERG
jgi:ATP-dependent helicase HrpA